MIQRIQSIFILVSAVLQVVFLKASLAQYFISNKVVDFYAMGFYVQPEKAEKIFSTFTLAILSWVILFLTAVSLFLYKKRMLQIRFCIYSLLLNIGEIGLILFFMNSFNGNFQPESHSYKLALVIPVANAILLYLAFRGIRKDELLVKAYHRLR
ncbi:MAG: DUF4293 domain-containing protein [Bacteroidota bacterium]|nr:MAG: DUF4293 domain-containing protein [Bacteroidota bacterium]